MIQIRIHRRKADSLWAFTITSAISKRIPRQNRGGGFRTQGDATTAALKAIGVDGFQVAIETPEHFAARCDAAMKRIDAPQDAEEFCENCGSTGGACCVCGHADRKVAVPA